VGLDPPTSTMLSPLLKSLAHNNAPRLILGLRPQDPLPEWITHTVLLGSSLCLPHTNGLKRRSTVNTDHSMLDGIGDDGFANTGLGSDQVLICIGHVKEELPGVVRDWLCLPKPGSGKPARFGKLSLPLEADANDELWNEFGLHNQP